MHMKRALVAIDDVHNLAWVREALAGVDMSLTECSIDGMHKRLIDETFDLLVLDTTASVEKLLQLIERIAHEGAEVRLLAMIDPPDLAILRMPVGFPVDFFVRGASAEELVARARGLLWPGEAVSDDEIIRIEQLTLNLATYQAHVAGKAVDFTYLEYALFAFLVTHPGRTYSRDVLLRRVWGSDYFGGSRTVDVHIRRVRSKLGPELSRRLETVRNVGYLWVG